MNFEQTSEFKKELKSLSKRIPTIQLDVKRVYSKLEALYVDTTEYDIKEYRKQFFDSKNAVILSGSNEATDIIKMRLHTETVQFRQKLRIVLIAKKEGNNILLLEVFSKSDKNRDQPRRYTASQRAGTTRGKRG